MVMVGLKMFSGGTPGLDTIMAWFPEIWYVKLTFPSLKKAVTWYNKEREENREDAACHDLALGHARDHRQGETEAKEVRPVYLNKVQSFVELNS